MTVLPRLALVAATAFSLLGGTALAQDKTFNIWWFEGAESAQGITWTKALEELKANHPDVTVNFEQKTFDQMQQSGSMILNSNRGARHPRIQQGQRDGGSRGQPGFADQSRRGFHGRGLGQDSQ